MNPEERLSWICKEHLARGAVAIHKEDLLAQLRAAVNEERESCARTVEHYGWFFLWRRWRIHRIAAAIRART